jgi:hypothetical protein
VTTKDHSLATGADGSGGVFQQNLEAECAADDVRGPFFRLVYNEQHAPAVQWFGEHGWTAVNTPLPDLLRSLGRPVPEPDSESGQMSFRINLVSATKG